MSRGEFCDRKRGWGRHSEGAVGSDLVVVLEPAIDYNADLGDGSEGLPVEQLGVARATVSAWETGRTEPSATNFVMWAELTGQELTRLAEGVKCARRDSNPQPSDP